MKKIEKWRKDEPKDSFFFRPKINVTKESPQGNNCYVYSYLCILYDIATFFLLMISIFVFSDSFQDDNLSDDGEDDSAMDEVFLEESCGLLFVYQVHQ